MSKCDCSYLKSIGNERFEVVHSYRCDMGALKIADTRMGYAHIGLNDVKIQMDGLEQVIRDLQRKLGLAVDKMSTLKNWTEIQLDQSNEVFECRGDEDCDHCHGLRIIVEIDEALKEIKEEA